MTSSGTKSLKRIWFPRSNFRTTALLWFLFVCFYFIGASQSWAGPTENVFTMVVGSVSDQVVTAREVKIATLVDHFLFSNREALGKIDDEVYHVLLEIAVAMESKPFSIDVTDEEIAQSEKKVLASASATSVKGSWDNLDPERKELRTILGFKIKARKFIEFKNKASVLSVSDSDAMQYFEKNKKKFGSAPFSQFKDTIKSVLSQQQAEGRMKDWFVVLQKKYKIRKIASIGSE